MISKTIKSVITFVVFTISAVSYAQSEPIYLDGFAQGTSYHISYYDVKGRFLKKEIDSILHDFDLSVSTYNPNSIISKINTNQKKVVLDHYFTTCFLKGKEIWKNTEGAFDPTVYSLVNAWGFGPGKKEKMEPKKIDSLLKFVGFNLIELKGKTIKKKDPRVALDFNAFAQGYSVDVIAEYLNSLDIKSYIVEIGGEVYAQGKQANNENWKIGIEQPIENKTDTNPFIVTLNLDGMAVATSGNYRKFTVENGIKYAHHIDPKTGYPTKNNLLSASIFSKSGIDSDANATGVLVMGLEKAKLFLKAHPELQAFLIYSDEHGNYQTYQTEGIASLIVKE